MRIDELNAKGKEYSKALDDINRNRQEWSAHRDRIKSVLDHIKNLESLKPHAMTVRSFGLAGQQCVEITFGRSSTGLAEEENGTNKIVLKNGGDFKLVQLYSGLVGVIITYPELNVDGIRDEQDPEILATYRPSELTEEVICDHFDTFLDKMIAWEKGEVD